MILGTLRSHSVELRRYFSRLLDVLNFTGEVRVKILVKINLLIAHVVQGLRNESTKAA